MLKPRKAVATLECRRFSKRVAIFLCLLVVLSARERSIPSGKKELAVVVTLDDGGSASSHNNAGRYVAFKSMWKDKCGHQNIDVEKFVGLKSARQGEGLTRTFIKILEYAEKKRVDTLYVFEDDVILLNSLFCNSSFRMHLWRSAPEDTIVLFLAAHHVKYAEKFTVDSFWRLTLHSVDWSLGSYAWSVERNRFKPHDAAFYSI